MREQTSPKSGDHVFDEQLQRLLLLGVRQAVVAPEAELVDAQFLVVLDAWNDLFRCADHRRLVQAFEGEFGTLDEFLFRARREEAVDGRLLVAEPGIEGAIKLRDRFGPDLPAFRVVCGVDVGMAQDHELWAWHVWVVGQRGLELVLQVDNFLVALHQWCDHDVAAVRHRKVVRVRIASSNPHWRRIDGLGHAGRGREFPDIAVVGIVASPQGSHHWDHFAQGLAAFGRRHATGHPIKFDLIGTACQADLHAPVTDHVQQRTFACNPQRVPERRDDGACAQVDGLGSGRQIRQQRHGAWGDGVFHRVVLADPDCAEAAFLGHQRELGEVFEKLAVADGFVPAFHVHEQRKFHDTYLDQIGVRLWQHSYFQMSGMSKCVSGQRGKGAHLAPAIHHRVDRLLRLNQVLDRAHHDRVIATFILAPQFTLDDRRGVAQQRVAQRAQRPLDPFGLEFAFAGEGVGFFLL
ncbi:hypothetical protein ALP40_05457 [Pseudomonas viridiflava]|uniref:Uncharacterized protein n=1 Tax=Pseudomonas viridiflava TaxID=33069 RepID=A0A3M5PIL3_PSEVI|nr:hypothetical protein ALP40_05457 [Pseudomonas viridiflava]